MATVTIHSMDFNHTTDTLIEAGIEYKIKPLSYEWEIVLIADFEKLEKWMREEYCVGMEPEDAAEYISDIIA